MREIRDFVSVDVPAAQAEQCILAFFEQHRRGDGAIAFPLYVNLDDFGLPGGLKLSRIVDVHVAKHRDAQNLNDVIGVRWDPGEGEPFPSFSGNLAVWSEGLETFIELRGKYDPPLGAPGKVFDDAFGHLLAERTVHQFLLTLAEGAQACFDR